MFMKTIYLFLLSITIFSCQNQTKVDADIAKKATIDSMKIVIENQKIIDSMNLKMAKIVRQKQEKEVVYVNQNGSSTTTNTTTKKKKWSGAAKGAVIGAGVGAVTGAIISKKKGEGAIIGGIAGAGVGAVTGDIIEDSKKKK